MKSELVIAITQLSAEKHLPKEVVLQVVESALVSAYKKDSFATSQNISVKIHPTTGKVRVFLQKTVVEKPSDPKNEFSLEEAQKLKKDAQIGDSVEVEVTPANAGRIAAQTAKQVVLQRLREAERDAIFEEFAGREADIVSGVVRRIEPQQIFLDLGRTEAVLPSTEQVRTERYRTDQRLKVFLLEVQRTSRGPQVIVSRTHRNLLKRLMELEIPEVHNGTVEIRSVAREPGFRSKVAVAALQEGVDPVGSCVGLRGIRIQNIMSELNGEKIDVVLWDPSPANFVANALSPAQVLSVEVNEAERAAKVVVPDRQLSLAIGKEGQNARLAAKLTGWRIDIKSATAAEAEKAPPPTVEAIKEDLAAPAKAETPEKAQPVEVEAKAAVGAEAKVEKAEVAPPPSPPEWELAKAAPEQAPSEPAPEVTLTTVEEILQKLEAASEKAPLRFAEDLFATTSSSRVESKSKKKKKAPGKEDVAKAGVKTKKMRPRSEDFLNQAEEET